MAVVAPIPSASVTSPLAANRRSFARARRAWAQAVEPAKAHRVVGILAHDGPIAEPAARFGARGVGMQALLAQLALDQVDVQAHLVVEIALCPRPVRNQPQPADQIADSHQSSEGRRPPDSPTRALAALVRAFTWPRGRGSPRATRARSARARR